MDQTKKPLRLLIIAWIPSYVYTQYSLIWLRISLQKFRFLCLSVGISLLNLLMLYALTLMRDFTNYNILAINAISCWIFLLIGFRWLRKNFSFSIEKEWLQKLFHLGFPMMLVMLTSQLSSSLDRFFLVNYLDSDKLGVYMLNQKLTVIIVVFISAFQMVINPFIFSIWNKPDAAHTFSRFQSYYLIVFGILAIVICSFSKWLIGLIGTEEYRGPANFFPVLIMGNIFYGMYSF